MYCRHEAIEFPGTFHNILDLVLFSTVYLFLRKPWCFGE
jgi:hypothetical protein